MIIGVVSIVLHSFNSEGNFDGDVFYYFTIQSNILCLLVLLYMIVKECIFKSSFTNAMYIIKAITTAMITVTCLIYTFVLMPVVGHLEEFAVGTFHNICLHFVIPIGYFLDYLLFDKKGLQKWFNPFLNLIYPILYAVMVFVRSLSYTGENKYIYPFLDIDSLGITQVGQNMVVMLFGIIILGFVFFGIDKLLGLTSRKKVEVIDTSYFLHK